MVENQVLRRILRMRVHAEVSLTGKRQKNLLNELCAKRNSMIFTSLCTLPN